MCPCKERKSARQRSGSGSAGIGLARNGSNSVAFKSVDRDTKLQRKVTDKEKTTKNQEKRRDLKPTKVNAQTSKSKHN